MVHEVYYLQIIEKDIYGHYSTWKGFRTAEADKNLRISVKKNVSIIHFFYNFLSKSLLTNKRVPTVLIKNNFHFSTITL